jgi:hypothetical protein
MSRFEKVGPNSRDETKLKLGLGADEKELEKEPGIARPNE